MTGGLEGLLAGRTLVKRYRIQEVIGRGGFAVVYLADDLRLGRPTAVKVLTLAAPTPEAREQIRARFEREARSAASLPHHPNVVPVYDFGTDAELGIDFIVMELLRGENVAAYLDREGRPPLPLSLRILRDAAEGLAVGHRAKLIHRDVKPGNLFLAEPQGEQPFRVCVLDFGIARVMDEDEENSLTRTRGGLPLSPAYASPEQLRGDRELTAASDVFSLGVVGYQLLTGEKPFDQDRVPGVAESIPPVRQLNPQVPAAVEAVIARATHPEPARRYADAGAFAAAIDAAVDQDDETVLAAPAPIREEEDDRTVLATPAAAVVIPVAVAAEPVRVPIPEPAPRSAPATAVKTKKSTPAWMVVLAVLLVVGAAGVWAMSGGG
ncbi:MAG TPA: serine/threonine-protein kinase, partial [Longimicrobium sp.]|nr:serine/threonine-protein kinase [Longimicrobium sp.]